MKTVSKEKIYDKQFKNCNNMSRCFFVAEYLLPSEKNSVIHSCKTKNVYYKIGAEDTF